MAKLTNLNFWKLTKITATFILAFILMASFVNAISPNIALDNIPSSTTYSITTDGSSYYGTAYNGSLVSSSATFPTVFNTVLTALGTPAKGKIHLGLGTFQMAGYEFTINGLGTTDVDAMRQIIIEGEGKDTIINQASQSKRIFVFQSRACFVLRDLKLSMRASNDALSETALHLSDGGSSLISSYGSEIENVWVTGGDNTHPLVLLENPFRLEQSGFLWIYATYGNALRIYNNNSGVSYGNSNFNQIYARAGSTGTSLEIEGNTNHPGRQMNILTFQHFEAGSGKYGIFAKGHTKFVHFDYVNIESIQTGGSVVKIGDNEGATQDISIDALNGGVPTNGYFIDLNYSSNFRVLGGSVWAEEDAVNYYILRDVGNYGSPNQVSLNLGENGDISNTSRFTITSSIKPKLKLSGWNSAGSYEYYTPRQSYTAAVTNGTWILIRVGMTPTNYWAMGTVMGEIVSVLGVNGTHMKIAIIKHDGTAGTSQTIEWFAGYYP